MEPPAANSMKDTSYIQRPSVCCQQMGVQAGFAGRYMEYLESAAAQIAELQELPAENALVINLGPGWLRSDAYSLFNNNVIENHFRDWESPPGLGTCPLDVIFTVCSNMSSWLDLSDTNHVVRQ